MGYPVPVRGASGGLWVYGYGLGLGLVVWVMGVSESHAWIGDRGYWLGLWIRFIG